MWTPPPVHNLEEKRAKTMWTHPRVCEDFFPPQIGMRDA